MSILQLELPDDLYASVVELAAQRGEAVDEFCLRHLRADIAAEQQNGDITSDPFWQAAGRLHSDTPDLAERHDEYLAAAIADDHVDELS